MASTTVLGLPPIPAELKTTSPYLQRADELRTKEPVMAYWCGYHAAQIGISIGARTPAARSFLAALLTALEAMKKEIGPNDAVDIEAASAAYVENFALKVFAVADNEDRAGRANRSTAKRFLAAAHFLEVLTVFPSSEVSESNGEKIRYAKWKAADIAKAFREGRKPAAGPAGGASSPSLTGEFGTETSPVSIPSTIGPQTSPPSASPPRSPPRNNRMSPPPTMKASDILRANLNQPPHTPQRSGNSGLDDGQWSNVATPGSAYDSHDSSSSTPASKNNKMRSESKLRSGWGGDDTGEPDTADIGSAAASKSVRFTPSVVGGESSTAGSPPQIVRDLGQSAAISPSGLPYVTPLPGSAGTSPEGPNVHVAPSETSPIAPSAPSLTPPRRSPPQLSPPSVPAAQHWAPAAHPPPPAPSVPQPPPDLTPQVIARAQKHCRFAISALDYEDAAQAIKELRAALAVLGGAPASSTSAFLRTGVDRSSRSV